MTIEQVRRLLHAQPFRPFRINLADGRSVPVRHPQFVAHSPTSRTIAVLETDEAFEIIDLLLVTSLDVGNGSSSNRTRKKR
jgi:hypothetical protein